MMTVKTVVDLISSLGFPIAVAIFALWNSHEHEKYLQGVLDTTLKENTKAIERLSDLIEGGLVWARVNTKTENKESEEKENENVEKWN